VPLAEICERIAALEHHHHQHDGDQGARYEHDHQLRAGRHAREDQQPRGEPQQDRRRQHAPEPAVQKARDFLAEVQQARARGFRREHQAQADAGRGDQDRAGNVGDHECPVRAAGAEHQVRDPHRGEREGGERNRVERQPQERRGDARAERRAGRRLRGRMALDEIVPRRPLRAPARGEDRGQHRELDEEALRPAAAGNLVRALGQRIGQLRPTLGKDGTALVQVLARALQRGAQPRELHHEAAAGRLRGGGVLLGVLVQLAREQLARLRVGELREQRVDVGGGEVLGNGRRR